MPAYPVAPAPSTAQTQAHTWSSAFVYLNGHVSIFMTKTGRVVTAAIMKSKIRALATAPEYTSEITIPSSHRPMVGSHPEFPVQLQWSTSNYRGHLIVGSHMSLRTKVALPTSTFVTFIPTVLTWITD